MLSAVVSIEVVVGQGRQDGSSVNARPDLAGSWRLDLSKSNLGSLKPDLLYDQLFLEIFYHEPKLTITRKVIKDKRERLQQLAYYIDSRGEKNPTFTGKGTIKSKTKWDGTSLLVDGIMSAPVGGDTIVQQMNERWEISSDGNTLTQVIKSGPFRSTFGKTVFMYQGIETIKRVFTRVH